MRIEDSPSLADLTTLGVGGTALAGIRLETPADFDALPAALERIGGKPVVLGGGSNLLAAEGELPLTLIRPLTGAGSRPEVVGEERTEQGPMQLVRAGSGLRMPALLAWCAEQGLSGLEGLTGVPGRLGGAVAMNAGAYDCSLAPLLREVKVFTPEDGLTSLGPEDWTATYRSFALKKKHVWFAVIEVMLALPARGRDHVRAAMAACLNRKKNTQPLTERTAGCVFKNPPGMSAGRLLDEAGLRGRREGRMRFTEKHANFLARDRHPERSDPSGKGNFEAAAALITEAREAVARRTGFTLELEIKVWPCPLF